ncbi:hypothetical protein Tco_0265462 [Tanacetum coccineum]
MLLLIAQNKLFNLDGDVIVDFVTALKMFTQGIIVKYRVEDIQLGVECYHRKLNITKPQRSCQHLSVKEPYTPNYDPPGIIYEDKRRKKMLMRVDEIHKFCVGTLQLVCKILHERLLNFKFGYNKGMPLREWTKKDKICTGIMLNKIDDLEILLNLNLLDHMSVLTEPEVHIKMEMEIPSSSRIKEFWCTAIASHPNPPTDNSEDTRPENCLSYGLEDSIHIWTKVDIGEIIYNNLVTRLINKSRQKKKSNSKKTPTKTKVTLPFEPTEDSKQSHLVSSGHVPNPQDPERNKQLASTGLPFTQLDEGTHKS